MKCIPVFLLILVGCTRSDPPPSASNDSQTEALGQFEIAELHSHVPAFNQKVRALSGFSDLWVEDEPTWRVIAAFTDPPPAQVVRSLAPAKIRERVEVRAAKRDQRQIGAGMDAITAALNAAGFEYTASYSPRTQRFAITVGTPANIERARQLVPAELARDTDVAAGPLPVSLTPPQLENAQPQN